MTRLVTIDADKLEEMERKIAMFEQTAADGGRNLTLHADWYLFKMQFALWQAGKKDARVGTELFIRNNAFGNAYTVFVGLERIIDFIKSMKVTEADIAYMKSHLPQAPEAYWDELRSMRFTGDLFAFREGALFFPKEPVVRVVSRVFEAVIVETVLLNFINHESLIATKGARVMDALNGKGILATDGGARRSHGADAAKNGTQALYKIGFDGTSLVTAGRDYHVPLFGSMAHFWVTFWESELISFRKWGETFPDDCSLLIDTYDTLKSGVPNAIIVAKELESRGKRLKAVRIDSGDLSYLAKQTRRMLDNADLSYVKIIGSGDLDENTAETLLYQGAPYDSFLFGTKTITAFDQPALGAVYKLIAVDRQGDWVPVIKISSNPAKVLEPLFKDSYRIVDKTTGKAKGDYIAAIDEDLSGLSEIRLFDPEAPELNYKVVKNFEAKKLMIPVFQHGEQVYSLPPIEEIRVYHKAQKELLWEEHKRLANPQIYAVTISEKITAKKLELIKKAKEAISDE